MNKSTFEVFLPDRHAPICIEADSFTHFGCELVLHKDEEMVARSSDRGFVVRADLVRAARLDDGLLAGETVMPYVERIAPTEVAAFEMNPAPAWPFSAGVAVGVLVGLFVAGSLLVWL